MRERGWFWTAIIIFVLSRLIFLWFVYPKFFWSEELHRGVLAHEIIEGKLSRPLDGYRADHYSGGSQVAGFMAVPFFLAFGQTAFALKLVGLAFFTAALMLWLIICFRYFNFRTAAFFGLFFILSPPFFTEMSVTTMGYHSESILFTAAALLVFFRIFYDEKKHWLNFAILGTICGLGVWFTYIFGVTLITLLICWFLSDRKVFLSGHFRIFCLGFLAGFSPWIHYNLAHHFQGLYIHYQPLHQFLNIKYLPGLFIPGESSIGYLYGSPGYNNFWRINRTVFSIIHFSILVSAFLFILYDLRKTVPISKVRFFNIYFAAMIISFQMLSDPGHRFMITLYPFIFFYFARFLNGLSDLKNGKKAAAVIAAVLVSISLMGTLPMLSARFAGYGWRARGFSYFHFAGLDIFKNDANIYKMEKNITLPPGIEARYLDDYYQNLAYAPDILSKAEMIEMIKYSKRIEKQYRGYFYGMVGSCLHDVLKDDLVQAEAIIRMVDPEYRRFVYAGWTESLAFAPASYGKGKKLLKYIGEDYAPLYYRIQGEAHESNYLKIYRKIENRYLPDYFEGAGRYLMYTYICAGKDDAVFPLIKSTDKKYLPALLRGARHQAGEFIKEEPANIIFWKKFNEELEKQKIAL